MFLGVVFIAQLDIVVGYLADKSHFASSNPPAAMAWPVNVPCLQRKTEDFIGS
jgi:hypothetical protein